MGAKPFINPCFYSSHSSPLTGQTKMVAAKNPKPSKDIQAIQSDVVSFASSLGFSSAGAATPSSGFNDSDFRKTGSLKAKPHSQPPANSKQNSRPKPPVKDSNAKPKPRPNPKPVQNQNHDARKVDLFGENDYSKFKNLPLVKASALGVWHEDSAELEERLIGRDKRIEYKSVEEWKSLVVKKKELGERLLAQYTQDYFSSRGQSGDIKMLIATQRSGTAADKVSALSVLIGDNAVANLRSIDALLGLVTSKVGKRHAFTAFNALTEMFLILLPDRRLKTLFQRPVNHLADTKDGYSLLLFWHWEECLKERYERFVSALEEASRDVIVKLKTLALKIIFKLLSSKSEQERRLLTSLVNKLGDPENKIASNADYHLANLLTAHPNMKAVVIDEVDNFLFRPHLGMRAKYHAVNFLTQIRLSHKGDGPKAAKRLIDIYFALFKILISEAGPAPPAGKHERKASSSSKEVDKKSVSSELHVEMDSRLLSALLTGVNRAFPYVSSDEANDIIDVQTPLLFQLVHSKNFNVGVQALMLLDKISVRNQIVSDRFYRALYSKLLLPAAMRSSKEEMFISLLLRAMKNDINIKRVAAFSKRLLQVAIQLPPQYACGCLFLLSEVLKARPPLWNMVLQNETANADEDLEHFEDIIEDNDKQAILAPDDKDNNHQVSDISNESDDDTDSSLDEGGSAASDSEDGVDETDNLLGVVASDRFEESKSTSDHEVENRERPTLPGGYDPRHREPTYCNADRSGWWELTVLASHVHPSVAVMARTLLSGVNIVYDGNPVSDLTLVAFLDKFMEKKPRQTTWRGASQIEPAKKLDTNHQLIGAEIISLAEADVPPEDVVFHKFYMNKMNSSKKPKKKAKKTADDEAAEELYAVNGDEDESENEEIEEMLDSVNPTLEADGDYDYNDLDKIADEDDEDLIGDASDGEIDFPLHVDMEEDDENGDVSSGDDSGDDIAIGEADDGSDFDDLSAIGEADDGSDFDDLSDKYEIKKKRKPRGKSGASPFASLEDYQHLMEDDGPAAASDSSKRKRKTESKKKQKMS